MAFAEYPVQSLMYITNRPELVFTEGRGSWLTDHNGKRYLDFVQGWAVNALGHSNEGMIEALETQARKLLNPSPAFYNEPMLRLSKQLTDNSCFDKVFFANSGAEANEGAIKLARKWGKERRGPECYRIVTAEGSFHGRTLGTLAATGQPSKQETFEPLPAGFTHVPLNDLAALEAAVDENTCAVMLEPVLGESGVWPCEPAYLTAVERLCAERDVLLVVDEVQTGIYRTGTAFAHQGYRVRPHIMTLAKSLANGLPMGAIVAVDDVANTFKPGDHGSTFGGGPVLCVAALATLSAHHEERTAENAVHVGAYLRGQLDALAARSGGAISDVRSRGLMAAVSLGEPIAQRVAADALGQGCVLNPIGDRIIRFLPPLVCGKAEVDTIAGILPDLIGM